ncbi:MAG: hypothetical protein QM713_07000 [Arachnia sp.]
MSGTLLRSGSPPPTSTILPGSGWTTRVANVSLPSNALSRAIAVSVLVLDAGMSGVSAPREATTVPVSGSITS